MLFVQTYMLQMWRKIDIIMHIVMAFKIATVSKKQPRWVTGFHVAMAILHVLKHPNVNMRELKREMGMVTAQEAAECTLDEQLLSNVWGLAADSVTYVASAVTAVQRGDIALERVLAANMLYFVLRRLKFIW